MHIYIHIIDWTNILYKNKVNKMKIWPGYSSVTDLLPNMCKTLVNLSIMKEKKIYRK